VGQERANGRRALCEIRSAGSGPWLTSRADIAAINRYINQARHHVRAFGV
jgi:hypothetical protein